jgi:hypothetical protein
MTRLSLFLACQHLNSGWGRGGGRIFVIARIRAGSIFMRLCLVFIDVRCFRLPPGVRVLQVEDHCSKLIEFERFTYLYCSEQCPCSVVKVFRYLIRSFPALRSTAYSVLKFSQLFVIGLTCAPLSVLFIHDLDLSREASKSFGEFGLQPRIGSYCCESIYVYKNVTASLYA